MNWKNLRIGAKLAIGFAIVIVLSAVIGTVGYTGMQSLIERINKTEDANKVSKYALDLRRYEKDFMLRHDEESQKNGVEVIKKISNQISESKLIFKDQKDLDDLELLKQKLKNYTGALEEYVGIYKEDYSVDLQKTILEGEKTIELCNALRISQKEQMQYEIAKIKNAKVLINRFEKNELSNNIAGLFAEIRIDAKSFVISRDKNDGEMVVGKLDKLIKLIEYTKNLMKKKADIEQLEGMLTAVTTYEDSFKNLVKVVQIQDNEAVVMVNSAREFIDVADKIKEGQEYKMIQEEKRASMMIVSFVFLGVIIGIIMAYIITRSITTGIKKGVDFATAISEGDLTAEIDIKQKDEVGMLTNALQLMVERFKDIVTNIVSGADNIASASQQMSSTSQEMSQGASEQASSTEEVSSSMEEMASNIQQNTENAQQTEKTSVIAATGISNVASSAQESLTSIKQIAEKITIVNDIAFQTNILALNAAVEAARAGEHGRGFAVVAAEVRKLAERSKIAADEIVGLTKTSVNVTEEAGILMVKILPEIEKTAKLVQEITAASMEQNSGADQVNSAIQQLNQVTQQNAAASEEMATGSEELSTQAEQLKEIVSFFKIDNKEKKKNIRNNNLQQFNADKAMSKQSKNSVENSSKKESTGFNLNLADNDKLDHEFESF